MGAILQVGKKVVVLIEHEFQKYFASCEIVPDEIHHLEMQHILLDFRFFGDITYFFLSPLKKVLMS